MKNVVRALLPLQDRFLIGQFARKEFVSRFRGSLLGFAWAFLNPLLMLSVYSFAFIVVFKARWPGLEESGGSGYALNLFCGLIVFNLFAEIATRTPSQILEQANLVKKVIFPLHILSWSSLLSALAQFAMSLTILLLGIALFSPHGLSVQIVAIPLILLVFVPFLLGLAWLLSSLGVFVRDLGQFMQVIVSLSLFVSPIFYPSSLLPDSLQLLFSLNPLTTIVEQTRQVLMLGLWPDLHALVMYGFFSTGFAVFAAVWFQRTQKGFADAL